MADTTSIDRLIDSNFDPAVAVEMIDRRLAVSSNPRTRDVLLDWRARWAFARDMGSAMPAADVADRPAGAR